MQHEDGVVPHSPYPRGDALWRSFPFGSDGGVVEVDETFIGRKKGREVRHGYEHKFKVLALVERNTGRTRMMVADNYEWLGKEPVTAAKKIGIQEISDENEKRENLNRHIGN